MRKLLLLLSIFCFSLVSVGCDGPSEVKAGAATSADFGPGVGVNEAGEPVGDGRVYFD